MIRATTIGVLKNYRYGLNNSFIKQNDARTTVLTHRNFNSFAEDPAAAAQSFQLRRARMTAESNYTVCDTTYRKFQSAWATLETVKQDVDNKVGEKSTIKADALKALNDPTGDARAALGKDLRELADTLVQIMNNKYGDDFMFSGADGQVVPFSWGPDGGLLYRGIPVDAAVPETLTAGTDADGNPKQISLPLDADGNYDAAGTDSYFVAGKAELAEYVPGEAAPDNAVTDAAGHAVLVDENGEYVGTIDPAQKYYYVTVQEGGTISKAEYETEAKDAAKLRYLSEDEKLYMDIGLGNEEDSATNKVISSTVFDSTLQGINFLGFGKDADGDPKNIVSLVHRMADICEKGSGQLTQEEYDELFRLTGKVEDASDVLHKAHVTMDARSNRLENNLGLLEQSQDTLVEQYAAIEDVDDADAISAFLWASYSYNAALRVGNSVLSQSLMDYMQ